MSPANVYVGIDVAKDWLDVAQRPGGERWRVSNDETGVVALVERLKGVRPTLVVLEATGGLQIPAVAALARSEERRVGKECRSRWSPYH